MGVPQSPENAYITGSLAIALPLAPVAKAEIIEVVVPSAGIVVGTAERTSFVNVDVGFVWVT